MAYDETKDKMIEEKKIGEEFRIAIFSYNEGTPKITIQKKIQFKDRKTGEEINTWTGKLGRLMKEEIVPIIEALNELVVEKKILDIEDKPELDN